MPSIREICATYALFRRALAHCFLAMAVLGLSLPAAAQGMFSPSFEIVPVAGGPGAARQISVSLNLPSGCLPTGATVIGNEIYRKRTLVIRLDGSLQDFQRCGDIIVNYRTTVSVKPEVEGDIRVLVVMSDGAYVGETTLRTRAANGNRSQYDLTGMWYDPVTHGSGLTFLHGFSRDDVVFGTWYVYDAFGAPRWYTIQQVFWKAGWLQAEGQIFETRANSVVCVPPFTGCPVAFATFLPQSQVRIVMQGPHHAQIQAIAPNGTVLFTSNIVRALF